MVKVKVDNPCTGLDRPWSFQEYEVPRFHDNRPRGFVNPTGRKVNVPSSRHWMWLYFVFAKHTDSTGCLEVPFLAHGIMTIVNDSEECGC